MSTKSEIRQRFLLNRNIGSISKRCFEKLISRAFNQIKSLPGNLIAAYSPVNGEINVTPLVNLLKKDGYQILIPVIIEGEMKFYHDDCVSGGGLNVKLKEKNAFPQAPDIAIVPAVTCDRKCNRIGYGKGFYDRYLNTINASSITLLPEKLICQEIIPVEAHDAKIDYLISESSIYSNSE